jgi:hypothetical protein
MMSTLHSHSTSKAFAIFSAIDEQRIGRELATAFERIDKYEKRVLAYDALPYKKRTPQLTAEYYHHRMLFTVAFRHLKDVPEELVVFHVDRAIEEIVGEEIVHAGDNSDLLLDLEDQMEEIRMKEGLGEDEDWLVGEGPDNYEELRRKYEDSIELMHTAILVRICNRYGFDDLAKLYENDRMTYDVMREVGRQIAFGINDFNREMEREMQQFFLREYGEEAVELLRMRLEQVRRVHG